MMTILFVTSATICILFTITMLGAVFGRPVKVPLPFFHMIPWSIANTYLSTPAIAYQVYFWALYNGILV